jgi:N-(2-amino-2-carboxyethyl)-L-glutamate synthase
VVGDDIEGILSTIGNTPLVRLKRLFPRSSSRIFAKLERFNPGGSIKDRSALSMLLGRIRDGLLIPGLSVVVESSSGNLAIGMAQICRYFDLRLICVLDARTTQQNIEILRAYDAEIELITEGDPVTGEFLPMRLRRVAELVETIPHAYSPNQYANLLNPRAHEHTMGEIARALDGRVDYLFCATSTFGTLRGCADYVRDHGMDTRIIAVDAIGSVIFGRPSARRLLPGHGASVVPELADPSLAHDVVHVSDLDCVVACRQLVAREAILAGGSAGATVAALNTSIQRIPADANVVLIFPDGGDRYLNTVYSDDWVTGHFGEISHLWKTEGATC